MSKETIKSYSKSLCENYKDFVFIFDSDLGVYVVKCPKDDTIQPDTQDTVFVNVTPENQCDTIDDVIAYVSELLREAEEIELVSEEEMFRPELDEVQDEGLQIDIEDGVYVVTGKSLRRIMYSVNFDDMESLQYFQKAMESQGVFDRLREMGIEDGDTVRIYEIEFEFYN